MAILYVLQGPDRGATLQVTRDRNIIGRQSDQVSLNDHTVSRRHATLAWEGDAWKIIDLGSSNGTYVNGERINGTSPLDYGDQIKIGATLMVFRRNAGTPNLERQQRAPESSEARSTEKLVDSSILSAIESSEESVILAAPEAADAVRAWNVMYQVAGAAGATGTVRDLLERVAAIIQHHLIVERLLILMRNEATGELEAAVTHGTAGGAVSDGGIATSRTIINHVIYNKSGVLCSNATADERFNHAAKAASLHNLALRSVICVPIVGHDQVLGIMHLDCPTSRHTFTHDQLRLATAIGRLLGLAIENRKLAEARLRTERLAATGETVAYLSHHIRNILQGLRSGADVVELGLQRDNTGTVRTGWRIVQHNLDRIFQLTTNMLTFSKNREPKIERAHLAGIITDAIDLARRQADDKGVILDVDFDEDMPAVPVDSEGLHQAVFNLIINAIAASPSRTGQVNIRTCFDARSNEVSITISDNGPGIAANQVEQVFRPFHSSKGQGGTGLGLAAAKKIIDELDGVIKLRTAVGEGTTFQIKLPATRPGNVDDTARQHVS